MPVSARLYAALAGTLLATSASAATFQTLYSFTGGADGAAPTGTLVADAAGQLYGTTGNGGTNFGTVFKLNPVTKKLVTLHTFASGPNGAHPYNGLAIGPDGALYGTANYGGSTACFNGCGTVYRIDPATQTFTLLHGFIGSDGEYPYARVTFSKAGQLYGTTQLGGSNCANNQGCGEVYQINPATQAFTKLYAFMQSASFVYPNGNEPYGSVVFDKKGTIYGTTIQGGQTTGPGVGTVFKLSPTHKLTVLHAFSGGTDGANPYDGLLLSTAGVLYGTTNRGGGVAGCNGTSGCGTVFGLDPKTKTLTTLHAFTLGADGGLPQAALAIDTSGLLYGTTTSGGNCTQCGTVFTLNATTQAFTTLHAFTNGADGGFPVGGVLVNRKGVIFGVTANGGTGCGTTGCGTIYKIVP